MPSHVENRKNLAKALQPDINWIKEELQMIDPGLHAMRVWMIISIILYAGALLVFMFGQNMLLRSLNAVSERLFGNRFPPIQESTEQFWLVLTNSMMLMLVIICIFVAVNPEKYLTMVVIILFSKFSSTSQYIFHFWKKKNFAHMAGVLSDGPLFIITLIMYIYAL